MIPISGWIDALGYTDDPPPPMTDFLCRTHPDDDAIFIIESPREIAHESADELRLTVERRLPDRDDAALVLDVSGVRLISSIGVAALLQIREFCRDRGAPLVLSGLPAGQREFLEMLQLGDKFDLADDFERAVDKLRGRSIG